MSISFKQTFRMYNLIFNFTTKKYIVFIFIYVSAINNYCFMSNELNNLII